MKKLETAQSQKDPDGDSTCNNTCCTSKRKKPAYFLHQCFHPMKNSFTNAKMTTYHNTVCFPRCSKITNIVCGKVNQMPKNVPFLFRLILDTKIQ